MKKLFLFIVIVLQLMSFAQAQSPQVDLILTVSNNSGMQHDLHFGLDPSATDGIDQGLGEINLPPPPPAGSFDTRFLLADDQSSMRDYRKGSSQSFKGVTEHIISYAPGDGKTITLSWSLPSGVTGILQDIITGNLINVPMNGSGTFTVQNPAGYNRLKMTISYFFIAPDAPALLSPADGAADQSANLNFQWQSTQGAQKYILQVALDGQFSSIVFAKDGIPDTTLHVAGLNNYSRYYWRVAAINIYGYSPWSQTFSFTTLLVPPAAPVLIAPQAGATDVQVSPKFLWHQANAAVSYDIQVSTDSSFTTIDREASGFSDTSIVVQNLLSYTQYYWRVSSINPAGTAVSRVSAFRTVRMPDLVVDTVIVPASVPSGQTYQVKWVVRNIGTGGTGSAQWFDAVFISPDSVFNANATQLQSFYAVSFLNPGETYTNSATFTLPQGNPGNYYIYVMANAFRTIPEISIDNNRTRIPKAMQVELTPSPDLIVQSIVPVSAVFSGNAAPITWTVKNRGAGKTIESHWTDAVYLSKDSVYNAAKEILLGEFIHTGILLPDSSYTITNSVIFPDAIQGTYFLHIYTNYKNEAYEFSNGNNNVLGTSGFRVILSPAPDYVVKSITIPDSAGPGDKISVSYSVKNQGGGAPFEDAFHDQIYISKASLFYPDSSLSLALLSRSEKLNPDSVYNVVAQVTIPGDYFGQYYIYVMTNSAKEIFENGADTNNIGRSSQSLKIGKYDLIVQQVSNPASGSPGQSFQISYQVKNIGTVAIKSKTILDRVYLSKNASFTEDSSVIIMQTSSVRSLPVGGTYAVQQSINLPDNLNGAYYLYVKTNASGALYEAEGGLQNNVLQSNAQVQYLLPDLAPIECKVLDTGLVSGGIVTLQWKVKNQGAGGLYNKTWGDEIFLSSSPVFSAQKDTLLGGNLQTTNLLSDSSYIVQKQFVLKEGIAGTYYFHLLANYNNAVNESNTGNNSSSSQPVNIKLAPWADLQVTSVTVPQSIGAGQQLLINWTAKNKGSAKIAGAQWIDKVYLSQKPALDINSALLISSVSLRDSIAVNGAYAKSTVYSIPTTTSGFYYAYVFTNADGAVYEFTDSANNIARSSGFTITPYPGADIAILSVNASDSISSGKSLLVKWSVKNISTARTLSDSWNDRIYLTKDSVLNTANLAALPFTFQHNGSLDSGAVYTNQVSFTVPNGIQGKYYIFVQSDYENKLNDLNVANNISGKKIIVQLTPSCDLRIASFSAPQYLTVGQPFTAGWKVINSGNGITPVNSWIDGLYLSQDSVISNNAIELGFFQRAQTLPKDSAYLTGDLSFTVPNNIEGGSYYLLAKTDSRNEVFEMNSKDNNVVVQPVYITVPPPADLLVTTINNPGTAVAGEQASVTWTLRNVGANPAVGYIEDAVYFSQDSTLTASAALMGIDSRYINLQPGSGLKVSRKIDLSKKIKTDSLGNVIGSMPGLAEGSYYVFVKTNIQASLPESSFLNNTGKSSGQTKISARTLTLGVPFTVGMQNMARKYYKVDVPANQDLRIQISGDQSAAANELYVAYNRAPDVNDYDFVSRTPYEPGQSLLVPSTSSGSYYIMAYAANVPVDTEHVTILASALPFTVLSSDQSQGGINGNVTIHLTGAGFRDSMTVYLSDGANLKYPLQLLERLSSTELYARADLHNKAKGIYDIVVVKADNTTAVLAKAFTVTSAQVSANISTDGPGTMRVRNTLSINAFVQNTGNVDLDYPFLAFTTNKSSVTISRIFNDRDSLIFSAADSLSGYLPVILEHTIPVGMTIRYRVELAAGATTDKVQVEVGGLLGADIASQCATPILWNLLKTSNTGNCPDIYTTAQLKTMFLSMADSAMKRWWIASAGKSFLSFLIDNSGKYLWTNPINGVAGKSQFSTVALNALFFDDKNNLRITDPCQGGIVMQQNYNALKDIVTVVPVDPNDMYGPFGFGDKKWVAANPGANVLYNYRINFENDSTKATAPALVVKVVSKIDSCLDIRTLRLGNYGFYNRTFQTSSSGASSIPHLWQDLTQQAGIYVDVFAGVDQKNNEVFWTFTTVDPITKQVPSDPMKGFLPVNDKTNRGQGFVNFTVRAKSTIHTGQIANAVGNIIFDAEQPISTPPIYNTLDALAPVSKVQKLPAIIDSTDFWVSWGGQDDSLGSDINSYTIWVSENGGPFNTWLANVSNTSAVFNGTQGSTYRFYSTARDNAGNTEVKSIPDASIAVGTSRLTSQKIILNKGWNMMSSYILPQQLSLDSIFAKMVAKILLMKSSSGNLYMPGSGINTIKNWQYAEGYKIYISSPDSVIISGQYIKSDIVPVIMNKGWNIVSYLRDIRQNVDTSFSSLHGKLKLAKNNAGQIYWPEYSINTIGKLNPGEGYQLFNTDVDSLIYPMLSNDYKNVFAKETGNATAAQTTPHYKLNYTATGTNATLLFDNLAGFSNAEIGAWDKNNLIGTGTVTDNKCVLTLWGDNPESKDIIEGAQSGDEISFTLWDPRIGKERPMEIQHLRDVIADKDTTPKVLFAPNAIQIASAKVNPVIPGTYSLGQNYPNPFNPVTIITYSLPAEDQVTITVYNILGRRIKTLVNEKQKAGYYTIQYSGENTASGVYFYRLETQHYTETKKMLLLK